MKNKRKVKATPTKKYELNDEDLDKQLEKSRKELQEAFELFDRDGSGEIDAAQLKDFMLSLKFNDKHPAIYDIFSNLENQGNVDFAAFTQAIEDRLGDKDNKEGVEKIYDLYIRQPEESNMNYNSLKKLADELGQNMKNEDVKKMLEKAAADLPELKFEEFVDYMTNPDYHA